MCVFSFFVVYCTFFVVYCTSLLFVSLYIFDILFLYIYYPFFVISMRIFVFSK